MNTTTEKGSVVFVTTTELPSVEVWVASPTGDISDSHTFHIMCQDAQQAQQLAETWRTVWGII